MKKKMTGVLCASLLLAAGAGWAAQDPPAQDPSAWSTPEPLLEQPLPVTGARPAVALVQGEPALLYPDKKGVTFRRGEKTQRLSEAPGGHFWLRTEGERIYALWWQKTPKRLFLRVSDDGGESFGPPVRLNTDEGVLTNISIAVGDKGRIAVAWQDERQPQYQVYVNRSLDGGRTWLERDIRLDSPIPPAADAEGPPPYAIEPQLAFLGERLVAVWQQLDLVDGKQTLRWLSRASDDGGGTWLPETEIRRAIGENPVETGAFAAGGRYYFLGFVPGKGLLAFASEKGGAAWQPVGPAPGTDKTKSVSWFRGAVSGDKLLVSYMWEPDTGGKAQVLVATIAGAQWAGEPFRLDRGKDDSTRSAYPALSALPDGALMAVWTDYRDLLPAIYVDYSADGGATWLVKPHPLTRPGLDSSRYPNLYPAGDRVFVLYQGEGTTGKRDWKDLVQILPYEAGKGPRLPHTPTGERLSEEELEKRLRQRVEEFWSLREKGELDKTWGFFDPAYRGRLNYNKWLGGQGRILFHDATVENLAVTGPLGRVGLKVSASVPQSIVGGDLTEMTPPKEQSFNQTWGWFYDDWYMIPPAVFGRHLDY